MRQAAHPGVVRRRAILAFLAALAVAAAAVALGMPDSARAAGACPASPAQAGKSLPGANLSSCNLSGFDFTGANLAGANLSKANLTNAKLDGANLTGANLNQATLTGVSAVGANLTRANLNKAGLAGANLTGATTTGVNVNGATCTGTNIYGLTGTLSCPGTVSITVPGAPTGVAATPGDQQAAVSFSAPAANGGSAVIDYTVTASPGGRTATGPSAPLTVTGLVNGQSYTFTVRARNVIGSGPASAASAPAVPFGKPGAPSITGVTPGNRQATVAFAAPASDNGSPITSYTVVASPGGASVTGATSPLTVTGLVNSITYTFTAVATNAAGDGAASAPSDPVRLDTNPPVVAIDVSATVEATGPAGASVAFTATADDAEGPTSPATCTIGGAPAVSPLALPLGAATIECASTDASDNVGTATATVTVVDTTAPIVVAPASETAEATGPAGAVVTFPQAGAVDVVDGELVPSCVLASGSTFPIGATTVVCSVTDAAGNTASASFQVAVTDTTAPVLDVQSAVGPLEATGPAGAPTPLLATAATDAVDGPVAVICSTAGSFGSLSATLPVGDTLVTCTATDAHGNSASTSFTVTVVDTTGPAVSPLAVVSPTHPDGAVEATSAAGAAVFYVVGAADAVDGPVSPVCTPASGSVFPLGVSTVTCQVVDARGNATFEERSVTVVDTTPPNVQPAFGDDFALAPGTVINGDGNVEATSAAGAAVSFRTPGWRDVVDANPEVTCSPASGSTFALGTTQVTCRSVDFSGNESLSTYVVGVSDTTAPNLLPAPGSPDAFRITSPVGANGAVEATSPAGAPVAFAPPRVGDLTDGSPSVACMPASGSTFPLGTSETVCTATDRFGNASTTTHAITVVDTTGPNIAPLPGQGFRVFTPLATDGSGVEGTSPQGATVDYGIPQIRDIVDASPSTFCTPASGSTFPVGVTTITCISTDAFGNAAISLYEVVVVDTTPPNIAPHPSGDFAVVSPLNGQGAVEATGPAGAVVDFRTPRWSDVVDTDSTVACVPASGSTFAIGRTTVTCTATDAAGNSADYAYSVDVSDTTAPSLLPAEGSPEAFRVTSPVHPDDATEATSAAGATVSYAPPRVGDITDPSPSVSCLPESGSTFPIGTSEVVCTSTDVYGNGRTTAHPVVVVDRTGPGIEPASPELDFAVISPTNASGAVEATGPMGAVAYYRSPQLRDLVDPSPSVTCVPASGSVFPIGTTTITCSAADSFGNSALTFRSVRVEDTTAPSIPPVPGEDFSILWAGTEMSALPGVVEAQSAAGAVVNYRLPAWSDTVDHAVEVSCAPASGSTFSIGQTTVLCTATDDHGNASTHPYAIAVADTTAPSIPHLPGEGLVPEGANADGTVEATGPATIVHFQLPRKQDKVDPSPRVDCLPASGSGFPLGTSQVTCTTTDMFGNQDTDHYLLTVVDRTGPANFQLRLFDPLNARGEIEAQTSIGTMVTYVVEATDSVDGAIGAECVPSVVELFPIGRTTLWCRATDSRGNQSTATFPIVISDTTGPRITVPGPITVDSPGGAPTAVSYAVTAWDAVTGAATPACAPPSGGQFSVGTTTVACTATDTYGNTSTASFTVTVRAV